jgi:hypothetical protein
VLNIVVKTQKVVYAVLDCWILIVMSLVRAVDYYYALREIMDEIYSEIF